MSPYRHPPTGHVPDPAWMPRPWWRRLPCLIGLHAWVHCAKLPPVDRCKFGVCRRCGAYGVEGPFFFKGAVVVRYAGPPLRCRGCGANHARPILHGCPIDYEEEPEYIARPVCPGCSVEIDPTTCGCGDPIEGHSYEQGHDAIPMGCRCAYVDDVIRGGS